MKQCKVCLIYQDLDKFSPAQTKDKLSNRCKKCHCDYVKRSLKDPLNSYFNYRNEYYKRNRDILLKKQKIWLKNNKKKAQQCTKNWLLKNPDYLKNYYRKKKEMSIMNEKQVNP